jgi:2-amino-4-hydroxy-6-hydroxymethyldihydropteridine diphosphokinase
VTTAVLSLGSNLGERVTHLRRAVALLGGTVRAVSGVYESPPWPPGSEGPPYLNAVVIADDGGRDARGWLERARELERAAGRVRDPHDRYAARTLDVDVITVTGPDGPVISDEPELTLPHPRAYLRAFVLRPWIDVQPYARLPGHGPLDDLLRREPVAADVAGLRPRPDLELVPAAG